MKLAAVSDPDVWLMIPAELSVRPPVVVRLAPSTMPPVFVARLIPPPPSTTAALTVRACPSTKLNPPPPALVNPAKVETALASVMVAPPDDDPVKDLPEIVPAICVIVPAEISVTVPVAPATRLVDKVRLLPAPIVCSVKFPLPTLSPPWITKPIVSVKLNPPAPVLVKLPSVLT